MTKGEKVYVKTRARVVRDVRCPECGNIMQLTWGDRDVVTCMYTRCKKFQVSYFMPLSYVVLDKVG